MLAWPGLSVVEEHCHFLHRLTFWDYVEQEKCLCVFGFKFITICQCSVCSVFYWRNIKGESMEGTRRVCTWLLGSKNIMNKLALVCLAKPPIAFPSNRSRQALKIESLMTKIKGSNVLGYWLDQTNHQKNFEVVWHSHPPKVFWKGKITKETISTSFSF